MRKFSYGLVTLCFGLFFQLITDRYLSELGFGPNILLLVVVATGFLMGPLMGETMGVCWGLMLDGMGTSYFGLQSLLFAIAGYLSGKLRRRVAFERPAAQIVVGLVATLYYFFAAYGVRVILDKSGPSLSLLPMIMAAVFNVLFVRGIFWIVDRWLLIWRIEREHID